MTPSVLRDAKQTTPASREPERPGWLGSVLRGTHAVVEEPPAVARRYGVPRR